MPSATCDECGREFDLAHEGDADEWAHGHDCEGDGPPNDDWISAAYERAAAPRMSSQDLILQELRVNG